MQEDEISAVQGQHNPFFSNREGEDIRVGDPLIGSSALLHRENIVAKPSKTLNDWQWEILVRVESCHLCLFLFSYLTFDL